MSVTRNTSSMKQQGHSNLRQPQSYYNKTLMTTTLSILDYYLLAGGLPPHGHVICTTAVLSLEY
ncbi:hypothetical protein NEAUS03_1097 [Nematocida ausubeli]|nr:hypothetical protein NEAUS03_1097 [Nematocida ausubeli]